MIRQNHKKLPLRWNKKGFLVLLKWKRLHWYNFVTERHILDGITWTHIIRYNMGMIYQYIYGLCLVDTDEGSFGNGHCIHTERFIVQASTYRSLSPSDLLKLLHKNFVFSNSLNSLFLSNKVQLNDCTLWQFEHGF